MTVETTSIFFSFNFCFVQCSAMLLLGGAGESSQKFVDKIVKMNALDNALFDYYYYRSGQMMSKACLALAQYRPPYSIRLTNFQFPLFSGLGEGRFYFSVYSVCLSLHSPPHFFIQFHYIQTHIKFEFYTRSLLPIQFYVFFHLLFDIFLYALFNFVFVFPFFRERERKRRKNEYRKHRQICFVISIAAILFHRLWFWVHSLRQSNSCKRQI